MDKLSFKDICKLEPLRQNGSKLELFNVELSNKDESKYAVIDEDGNIICRHDIDFARPCIHYDKIIEDAELRVKELIEDIKSRSNEYQQPY